MTKLDDNREYVVMGVTDDANATPTPLVVDSVTGRLLIEVNVVSSTVPVINKTQDENRESVGLVVDDNDEIKPLLIDNRNGYLWIDVLSE